MERCPVRVAFLTTALILFGCGMPRRQTTDPDLAVLNQLKAAGDESSVVRVVNFYLYFPTQSAAESAATDLVALGYASNVRRAAKGTEWLCLATKSLAPSKERLHMARRELEAVARKFTGEYDGWETAVQRRVR